MSPEWGAGPWVSRTAAPPRPHSLRSSDLGLSRQRRASAGTRLLDPERPRPPRVSLAGAPGRRLLGRSPRSRWGREPRLRVPAAPELAARERAGRTEHCTERSPERSAAAAALLGAPALRDGARSLQAAAGTSATARVPSGPRHDQRQVAAPGVCGSMTEGGGRGSGCGCSACPGAERPSAGTGMPRACPRPAGLPLEPSKRCRAAPEPDTLRPPRSASRAGR